VACDGRRSWGAGALGPGARVALGAVVPALVLALASGIQSAPATPSERSVPDKVTERMPGPWTPRTAGDVPSNAAQLNAECQKCHQQIAQEWQSSLHANAYTNAEFQRALAIEPQPFCRSCHAPDADPRLARTTPLHQQGVSCISCHVMEGAILGVANANARVSPHPVTRLAAFANVGACANCHEFTFPGELRTLATDLMQSTVSEHRASAEATRPCADCHMPVTQAGHRHHGFSVSHNQPLLRDALTVSVRRVNPTQVEFQLTPNGVGHAFPTGDLFRRLTVEVEALGPEFSIVASSRVYLTREFETEFSDGKFPRRRVIQDTRLLPGDPTPRRLTLELGEASAGLNFAWRVLYQRVEHPGKVGAPDARIAGEVELAAGLLTP
jgi:Cytochrome c554 and c-prime